MAMWNDYDKLARRLDRIANAFERIADALEADRKDEPPMDCKGCKHWKGGCDIDFPICKRDPVEDEPQTDEEYINNLPWTEIGNGEQTEPQTDCPWK